MRIVGISEGFHDAAMCVLIDNKIYHASHSERFSRLKNDKWIHKKQFPYMKSKPIVAYYEKPIWKNLRRLYAGQKWQSVDREYDVSFPHHKSHAAAGYYTAPFDDCNVLVIDSIGEWDTVSIWEGKDNKLKNMIGEYYHDAEVGENSKFQVVKSLKKIYVEKNNMIIIRRLLGVSESRADLQISTRLTIDT